MSDCLFGARLERVLLVACAQWRTAGDGAALRPFRPVLELRFVARRFADAVTALLPRNVSCLSNCPDHIDGVSSAPHVRDGQLVKRLLSLGDCGIAIQGRMSAYLSVCEDVAELPRLAADLEGTPRAAAVLRALRYVIISCHGYDGYDGDAGDDDGATVAAGAAANWAAIAALAVLVRRHAPALPLHLDLSYTFFMADTTLAEMLDAVNALALFCRVNLASAAPPRDPVTLGARALVKAPGWSEAALAPLRASTTRVLGGGAELLAEFKRTPRPSARHLIESIDRLAPPGGLGLRSELADAATRSLLHAAVASGEPAVVRHVLALSGAAAAEVNVGARSGTPPLCLALRACPGHLGGDSDGVWSPAPRPQPLPVALEIIELLLAAGASPTSRDWQGRTPMWLALALPAAVVDALLGLFARYGYAGAALDLGVPDLEDQTLLHVCCIEDWPTATAFDLLLQHGSGSGDTVLKAVNDDYETLLGACIAAGNRCRHAPGQRVARAMRLYERGASLGGVLDGISPLATACESTLWLPLLRRALAADPELVRAVEARKIVDAAGLFRDEYVHNLLVIALTYNTGADGHTSRVSETVELLRLLLDAGACVDLNHHLHWTTHTKKEARARAKVYAFVPELRPQH